MKGAKPINIKINEALEVEPDGIFMSKVVAGGNGGLIKFYKKYIGKQVIVILSDKIKGYLKPQKKYVDELPLSNEKDIGDLTELSYEMR